MSGEQRDASPGPYDFVIVGAGSAGAVVAARLSEDPDASVCVLEAGPDYVSRDATPPDLLDSRDLGGLQHDWRYVAIPVPGRTLAYRRGKVTGGTSAINAAAAHWGCREDFNSWVERGNQAWAWERVVPYYQKLESDPAHGTHGPIPVARYEEHELVPVQRAFYEACRAAGFPHVEDHNAERHGGVGPWAMNRQGTTRISTALAYLGPARGRRNLTIRPNTLVDKIRFQKKRAVGVELASGEVIRARTIVLSAGAFGSPSILMRSGIGPAGALRELGVEVAVDAPGVGANLQDHPTVPIYLVPKEGQCIPARDSRLQVLARFTAEGSREVDDLQLIMTTHTDISASPALREAAGGPVVAILKAGLMAPRGHGRVTLASTDPDVQPKIELNYGADPEDMRRLLHGTRLAWKIARSEPLGRETRGVVGLDEATVCSDERLREYILEHVGTYCHASGTARMGPDGDPGAVTDPHCRVRGVEGLWLADASVMPRIPCCGPNFTVMMLGERIADWLSGRETARQ